MYQRAELLGTTLCQLHLVQQLSSPKAFFRCEISCKVLICTTKTIAVSRCESFEISTVFYFKLYSRKQVISLSVFQEFSQLQQRSGSKTRVNLIQLLVKKSRIIAFELKIEGNIFFELFVRRLTSAGHKRERN